MSKTFRFVAGMEGDIPVAICLEHDFVVQAGTMDDLPGFCLEHLMVRVEICKEEGISPWDVEPPPAEAVEEFRGLPEFREFTVTID